jgi:hypothetical protein
MFGGYFGFKTFEYWLWAKPFLYEGDHNNLRWKDSFKSSKNYALENLYAII